MEEKKGKLVTWVDQLRTNQPYRNGYMDAMRMVMGVLKRKHSLESARKTIREHMQSVGPCLSG